MKCGSSSISRDWLPQQFGLCLAQIPAEYSYPQHRFPRYYEKETHFFDTGRPWGPSDAFTSLYNLKERPECSTNGFAEATPNNIHSWDAPRGIVTMAPTWVHKRIRYVAVLREPVSRDLSAYNHQRQVGVRWSSVCNAKLMDSYAKYSVCNMHHWRRTEASNSTYSKYGFGGDRGMKNDGPYLSMGVYVHQLRRWKEFVPRSQIFVCSMQAVLSESRLYMTRIALFLRLSMPSNGGLVDGKSQGGDTRLPNVLP